MLFLDEERVHYIYIYIYRTGESVMYLSQNKRNTLRHRILSYTR